MARVKRAVHGKKSRRAILEQAQGYYGNKSRSFKSANEAVMHAGNYAFRDRRARKGDFRKLWIQRINAGTRLAVTEPASFKALVDIARANISPTPNTNIAAAAEEAAS